MKNTIKSVVGTARSAARLSAALVLLTASILFLAELLGFTPQEQRQLLESRSRIAESLAIQMSVFIPDEDLTQIETLIWRMIKRSPDIASAGIHTEAGRLIYASPGHEENWAGYDGLASSPTHVLVPLLQNGQTWGAIELRFEELTGTSLADFHKLPIVKLVAFVALIGFVAYLLFLLRTLRQLDPMSVVPERVNTAFDTLVEGVLIVDESEVIMLANTAIADKLGVDRRLLIGRTLDELGWKLPEVTGTSEDWPWKRVVKQRESVVGAALTYHSPQGQEVKFALNASPVLDDAGALQGALITLDDVSSLEKSNTDLQYALNELQRTQLQVLQQNKQLTFLATRDPLTSCLNRRAFNDQFQNAFDRAREDRAELCCIMADLDHFKSVNDTFGHATGDEVIKLLADILTSNTRSEDLVGRFGGEEFCLVLPGMSVEVAMKTAERVRLRIRDESRKRYPQGPHVTACLGVASLDDGPENPEQLNQFADEALYAAKESGRNRVVRWAPKSESKTPSGERVTAQNQGPAATQLEEVEKLKQRIRELEEVAGFASEALEYKNNYDGLTGLPNHVLFTDRLNQSIEWGQRHDRLSAVLVIDIDHFSTTNNTFGRAVGDELLKQFSERLQATLRKTDGVTRLSASRLAGDEFAVLLTNLENQSDVTWAVKRIQEETSGSYEVQGHTIHLSQQIGISLYPVDATSSDDLIAHATTAKTYLKKRASQLKYQYYDAAMQETSVRHLGLEKELREAVEQEQWQLMFQPKIDTQRGVITGAEGLLRWQHPQRGMVSPLEFIRLAEERKMIIPIGDWVIKEACKQLVRLREEGFDDISLAINLSGVQLAEHSLADAILEHLADHKVPPRCLLLEVTETTMMDTIVMSTSTLARLKNRGMEVFLDDFGTGYSSMNYLKNLPLNGIKIDRTFVQDLEADSEDHQIISTLVKLSHALGLRVIAEGVETIEQLRILEDAGCDEIQGYLFSKPLMFDEFTDLLKNPNGFKEHLQEVSSVSAPAANQARLLN